MRNPAAHLAKYNLARSELARLLGRKIYYGRQQAVYLVRCDCGKERETLHGTLKNGAILACSKQCFRGWTQDKRASEIPEYNIWKSMMRRCYDPNDKRYSCYGGRGIKVCERWLKFDSFYADIGPRPLPLLTLDRKDNDGDYSPDNCRWATLKTQSRNKTSTRFVPFRGKTACLAEWSEVTGINSDTLASRLKAGWSVEHALTIPPIRGRLKIRYGGKR